MGYTTDFSGSLELSRLLTSKELKTINDFSEERHCNKTDQNDHSGFPGYWCNWCISTEGDINVLEWNEAEKFYNYVEWLQYLIDHFFSKWNVLLNGEIQWQGEDNKDMGKIFAKDSIITTKTAKIVWE